MAVLIYTAIIVVALVVQTTVFTTWPFFVVIPDLILVLVVLFSLINGPGFGAKSGFLAGLGFDLFVGELIGLHALTKMVIGFTVGLLALRFYKENYVVPLVSVLIATVADQLLYGLGMAFFGVTVPLKYLGEQVLLPLLLYNGVLCLLLYVRLYYFNKKIFYWDEIFRRSR
ncbi:MAG: rod shape-determining protein MreD [Firmicutes bacterium]|jgi:rod shape-determining protein MreD|nr:rod shape-determining protein MreD [Bacillota bacterium]NLL88315.1 rod shape-determining protein MreD [Bacillota bacterium]HKM16702.1 rod shape-determining protein MreD [Limnochordia bacterium]